MYVYIVEEYGEIANGERNGSFESDDNNAEHDAEPESFAKPDCEPESGGESRTKSEPERKPKASTIAWRADAEPDSEFKSDSNSKPESSDITISHREANQLKG